MEASMTKLPVRLVIVVLALLGLVTGGHAQQRGRLNRIIDLLEKKQMVFCGPMPRTVGRGRDAVVRPPAEVAKEAVNNKAIDCYFDASTETNFAATLMPFSETLLNLSQVGAANKMTNPG